MPCLILTQRHVVTYLPHVERTQSHTLHAAESLRRQHTREYVHRPTAYAYQRVKEEKNCRAAYDPYRNIRATVTRLSVAASHAVVSNVVILTADTTAAAERLHASYTVKHANVVARYATLLNVAATQRHDVNAARRLSPVGQTTVVHIQHIYAAAPAPHDTRRHRLQTTEGKRAYARLFACRRHVPIYSTERKTSAATLPHKMLMITLKYVGLRTTTVVYAQAIVAAVVQNKCHARDGRESAC
ncbi:hypothetical protein NPIL_275051 [Nephila pilipes]|uniref:Uncharacterized protein n=1 Tax=Nephila pilipes TaxID=299642 RepID=A0A8X6NCT0_NEPPI|nr:hypothetical protein NPIL_275051 [Nephila pilipes]